MTIIKTHDVIMIDLSNIIVHNKPLLRSSCSNQNKSSRFVSMDLTFLLNTCCVLTAERVWSLNPGCANIKDLLRA